MRSLAAWACTCLELKLAWAVLPTNRAEGGPRGGEEQERVLRVGVGTGLGIELARAWEMREWNCPWQTSHNAKPGRSAQVMLDPSISWDTPVQQQAEDLRLAYMASWQAYWLLFEGMDIRKSIDHFWLIVFFPAIFGRLSSMGCTPAYCLLTFLSLISLISTYFSLFQLNK